MPPTESRPGFQSYRRSAGKPTTGVVCNDIVTLHPSVAAYMAYVQGMIKRKLRRRSAIEAVTGHMKNEGCLPTPRLKTPDISPIFKAHSNSSEISAWKDGKFKEPGP